MSVTGCGGTLAGNTYTTGAITADCAITPAFAFSTVFSAISNTFTVSFDSDSDPIKDIKPEKTKPLCLGDATKGGDVLTLKVDLDKFANTVDLYLIFEMAGSYYITMPDNTLQPMGTALIKWRANVNTEVKETPLTGITVSSLPAGTFRIYLIATPVGDLSKYYLWVTEIPKTNKFKK